MSGSRPINLDQEEINTIRLSLMREVRRLADLYLTKEDANFIIYSDRIREVMHALEKFR